MVTNLVFPPQMHPNTHVKYEQTYSLIGIVCISLELCNLPTEPSVSRAGMPSLSLGLCHSYFTGKETKDPGGPLALHPSICFYKHES